MAIADKTAAQQAEFGAVNDLAYAMKCLPPIVDDSYPAFRARYEGRMQALIRRLIDNDRIGLTFRELAQANKTRCESPIGFKHKLGSWSASDWMTALTGEVGEAANVIKKMNRVRDGVGHMNKEKPDQLLPMLKGELGDIALYLDLLCQAMGTTMEECLREAFNNKSKEMGCPITV